MREKIYAEGNVIEFGVMQNLVATKMLETTDHYEPIELQVCTVQRNGRRFS